MYRVEDIPPGEFATVAHWLTRLPLLRRYGLDEDTATRQFAQAHEHGEYLLGVKNTDPVYCGLAWVLPDGAFGRSAYLRLIAVHPDHTGRGVGGTLLEAVEHLAVQHSHDLFLFVSDFNIPAQRFYQRHDYQQVGAIPGYVLPDVTELLYRKQLHQQP